MRGRLAAAVLVAGVLLPGMDEGSARPVTAGAPPAVSGPRGGQDPAGSPGDGREAAREPLDRERRVVRILAERFSFTPSEIRVPRGVTLELRIRSDDTLHGFRIVGRKVNLLVPKRRQGEAVVVFEAVEAGRYAFECSRLCGVGHNFMRGAIVVEDTQARAGGSAGDGALATRSRVGQAERGSDVP